MDFFGRVVDVEKSISLLFAAKIWTKVGAGKDAGVIELYDNLLAQIYLYASCTLTIVHDKVFNLVFLF